MIDLKEYGYSDEQSTSRDGQIPARITSLHRKLYQAVCEYGEVSAVLKGSFLYETTDRDGFPAVGDFVTLQYNPSGHSSIVKLLPRKSKFSRTDFSGHAVGYVKTILEQVVAANFDAVFIMSSLNQDFNASRIARYLTASRQSGGTPIIILTKVDLCENYEQALESLKDIADDVPVIALSSHTGQGLKQLGDYLKPGQTIVFLGMSGVGKSSLVNALAGQEIMSVREIRGDDARGRHTTTHRQMIRLPSGVLIIDTPGMRELGLWNAEEGINAGFPDIIELFSLCRFSDCKHQTEPGCAVLAALADGSLTQKQWESYLAQKREAAFVERKSGQSRQKKKAKK